MVLCRVAELIVEICENQYLHCDAYRVTSDGSVNISIVTENLSVKNNHGLSNEAIAYLDSGTQFYRQLLKYNGMMLHASAVALDGRAYLFSGPCGMGKSTHTRLWQQIFGEKAVVFNDDKPALRRMEETDGTYRWYAYGTPWCGKDGINVNMKVPLAGICFLRRGEENSIRRVNGLEATTYLVSQTLHKFKDESNLNLMLSHVDKLVREIPIFELKNLPVPDAARLSYETMRRAAEEMGL